jgi:hypothetical protein
MRVSSTTTLASLAESNPRVVFMFEILLIAVNALRNVIDFSSGFDH